MSDLYEQIVFRPWIEEDFDNAVLLNQRAEEHIGIGSESGDWALDMEGISETFAGSGGEFLIGELDECMVVMGGFKLHAPTIAEVKRIRVAPEIQGRGIGPRFLGRLEDDMRRIGIETSVVSTLSIQQAALKLYTRSGYTETGRTLLTEGPEAGFTVVSFIKNLV